MPAVLLTSGLVAALVVWGLMRYSHGVNPTPAELLQRRGFAWHTRETPHFWIHYEANSFAERNLGPLATVQERAMPRVLELLGEQDYPRKVHLFALESRERMKALINQETNGRAFPIHDMVLCVFAESVQATGAHELMHVVAFHCWGEMKPGRDWLSEGLAVYADNAWSCYELHALVRHLRESRHLLPLQQLLTNFRSHSDMITYPESGSLVRFLREQYGREKLKQLWSVDQADIQRIFGKSLTDLEAEWLRVIEKADSSNIRYDVGTSGLRAEASRHRTGRTDFRNHTGIPIHSQRTMKRVSAVMLR